MSLRATIEQEIRERGPLPFSRYMEICLYDPAQGYYSCSAEQFGKAGDFYTSSDVHAVFGRLLARQFQEMWQALNCPPQIEILELGPGRGLFARDALDWSKKKFPDFFDALTYTLQEASPALRARLQETLREHLDAGKAAVPEERPSLATALPVGAERKTTRSRKDGPPIHAALSPLKLPSLSSPTNSSTPSQSRFSARRANSTSPSKMIACRKPGSLHPPGN